MTRYEAIIASVYAAIKEVNLQLPESRRIVESEDTILLGDAGNLDSLDLISLVVAVEQEIEMTFHTSINITDRQDEIFTENGPFRTIASLVAYIAQLLEAKSNRKSTE